MSNWRETKVHVCSFFCNTITCACVLCDVASASYSYLVLSPCVRQPLNFEEMRGGRRIMGALVFALPSFLILLLSSIPSHDPDSSVSTLRSNIKTYLSICHDHIISVFACLLLCHSRNRIKKEIKRTPTTLAHRLDRSIRLLTLLSLRQVIQQREDVSKLAV